MKYHIKIKNVGKGEEFFKIRDDDGFKRNVEFSSRKAANEACRIIEHFREDTAFQYVRPVSAGHA